MNATLTRYEQLLSTLQGVQAVYWRAARQGHSSTLLRADELIIRLETRLWTDAMMAKVRAADCYPCLGTGRVQGFGSAHGKPCPAAACPECGDDNGHAPSDEGEVAPCPRCAVAR